MEDLPAPKPAFEDRVGSVFAALGQPAGWTLATDQGFKAGDDAAASSEDEQEASADVPHALAGMAESQQEEDDYNTKASCQYRRAFEEEEEEDAYDELAAEGLHRVKRVPAGDEPLPRSMEVLDDNVYDRQYEARRATGQDAGTSGIAQGSAGHQLLPPPSGAQPNGQRRGGAGSQVWLPPHRRVDFKPRQDAESQGVMRPPASRGSGGGGRGRGRAVPDHVRNPQKYTVYTFDEPVEVGGGIKASNGERELQQAAASALAAAHAAKQQALQEEPEENQELPQFGAGIEFRPKAKRHQAAHPSTERTQPQPAAAPARAIASFLQDDEADDMDAGPPAAAHAAAAPANGHALQGAASMEVDEGDGSPAQGAERAGQQLGSGRAAGGSARRRSLRSKPAAEED